MNVQTKIELNCPHCLNGWIPDQDGDMVGCPHCEGLGYKEIDLTDLIMYRDAIQNESENIYYEYYHRMRLQGEVRGINHVLKAIGII